MSSSRAQGKGDEHDDFDPSILLQSTLDRLQRLVALHERGALTDDEYEAERRLLLSSVAEALLEHR